MMDTGFMEWRNPDLSIDLICLNCFETVVRSQVHADFTTAKRSHLCNPSDLILLGAAAWQDQGKEKTPAPFKGNRGV
jgi:hypothetical protein